MNKRKDHRGRLLHTGEVQLADKRYRYKYVDFFGKEHAIYRWRLNHNDKPPAGKKHTLSLREMKKIEADLFDHIIPNGGKLTVLELVEKYTETKISVRPTIKAGYKTVIRLLQKDPFGQQHIDSVRLSDAKLWLIKL